MEGPFLGIDWGTTNRRIYLINAAGEVEKTERDAKGIVSVRQDEYPAEIASIRTRFGDLPIIIAGMAGSNRGWIEASYQTAPVALNDLASGLCWVEAGRTAIIPGVSQPDPADIMRGEEVQFFGAVEAGLAPSTSLLCQPGTHCKWAVVENGRIASFTTTMTGELFAMLARDSLLSSQLKNAPVLNQAFQNGVEKGARGNLMNSIFSVRASQILGQLSLEDSSSYLSGIIIGADVASNTKGGSTVYILADEQLGAFYRTVVEQLGGIAHVVDSHQAFVAGIVKLWKTVR